jgi:hypothetical protein
VRSAGAEHEQHSTAKEPDRFIANSDGATPHRVGTERRARNFAAPVRQATPS